MSGIQSVDSITPSGLLDLSQRIITYSLETQILWQEIMGENPDEGECIVAINWLAEESGKIDIGLFHWYCRAYMAVNADRDPLAQSESCYHEKAYFASDGFVGQLRLLGRTAGYNYPATVEKIDLNRAREVADAHYDEVVDIDSLQSPLRREAGQAANMLSAELQDGIDTKGADAPSDCSDDSAYLITDLLREFGGISPPTLNKYIDKTKVRKTRVGERDRRFTFKEREEIAAAIAEHGPGVTAQIAKQILAESKTKTKARN